MPRSRRGDLEQAVLDQLWSTGADRWWTVREVHEALAAHRDIAYTTVMTVLQRLAGKEMVRRRRDGRAHHYQAVAGRGVMTAGVMREALEELAGPDRRAALVAFVAGATDADRAALLGALGRPRGGPDAAGR